MSCFCFSQNATISETCVRLLTHYQGHDLGFRKMAQTAIRKHDSEQSTWFMSNKCKCLSTRASPSLMHSIDISPFGFISPNVWLPSIHVVLTCLCSARQEAKKGRSYFPVYGQGHQGALMCLVQVGLYLG